MMKKLGVRLLGMIAGVLFFSHDGFAAGLEPEWSFYYDVPTINSSTPRFDGREPDTDIGKIIKDDAVVKDDSLLTRLMVVFKLDTEEYNGPQKAFYYLRKLINYALSFVSLIAFGLLLYSFYMMLIWDGEKGRTQVKSTLKWIAIAIGVMSLSWLIVSMIFWSYDQQREQSYEQSKTTSVLWG